MSDTGISSSPRRVSHHFESRPAELRLKTVERRLGAQLITVPAASPDQLEPAFVLIRKERAAALLVLTDAMFFGERRRITELARSAVLPAIYSQREYVEAGGLASYGPSLVDMARRGAKHVDKVLRGAHPKDLPVEQPTKFELVLNLKTGRDLGVVIPPSVLARADDVVR